MTLTGRECPGWNRSGPGRTRSDRTACGDLNPWDASYCEGCGAPLTTEAWHAWIARDAVAREAAKRTAKELAA